MVSAVDLRGKQVSLHAIEEDDIPWLWERYHGEEHPEWKRWDGPYYPIVPVPLDAFIEQVKARLAADPFPRRLVIWKDGERIGTVSAYWVHEETMWMEVGITIFSSAHWGKGLGQEALAMWVGFLFAELAIVRIGLSTWSGNTRMIQCAEKLGMQCEGCIRKARIVEGLHYDSIKMGVLREEWEAQHGVSVFT